MAELKCPHCGQIFTVDDTEYNSILQQIRDSEFNKAVDSRIEETKTLMNAKAKMELETEISRIKNKDREEYEKQIEQIKEQLKNANDNTVQLQSKIDQSENIKKLLYQRQ